MPKQFLHIPTQKILTQIDWNDPDKKGDFTLISSDALVEQSSDPYSFNTVALLKDCKEISGLQEIFKPLLEEYKKLRNPTEEQLQDFIVYNGDFFTPETILNILEILKTL